MTSVQSLCRSILMLTACSISLPGCITMSVIGAIEKANSEPEFDFNDVQRKKDYREEKEFIKDAVDHAGIQNIKCESAVLQARLDYATDYYNRMLVVCQDKYSRWMQECKATALNKALEVRFSAPKASSECTYGYRINPFNEKYLLDYYLPESDEEYRTGEFYAYYMEIPEEIREKKITRPIETVEDLKIRIHMAEMYKMKSKNLDQEFVLSNVVGPDVNVSGLLEAEYRKYVPDAKILRFIPTGHWKTVRDQDDKILYKQFFAFPIISVQYDFKPFRCYRINECRHPSEEYVIGLKYQFEVRSDYKNGDYGAPYVVPFSDEVANLVPHLYSNNVYQKYDIRSIYSEDEILSKQSTKDAKPDGYVIDIPNPKEEAKAPSKPKKQKIMATEKEAQEGDKLQWQYSSLSHKMNTYENAISYRETHPCWTIHLDTEKLRCENEDRQNKIEYQQLKEQRDAVILEINHMNDTYDFSEVNNERLADYDAKQEREQNKAKSHPLNFD